MRGRPNEWVHADPSGRSRRGDASSTAYENLGDSDFEAVLPDPARRRGDKRWIRDRGFPIRDELGDVIRFAGIAEDITVQQAATRTPCATPPATSQEIAIRDPLTGLDQPPRSGERAVERECAPRTKRSGGRG